MNFYNQTIESKETLNKKWGVIIPRSSEVAIVLDMLERAKDSTEPNLEGESILINNNKSLHNDVNKNRIKQENT